LSLYFKSILLVTNAQLVTPFFNFFFLFSSTFICLEECSPFQCIFKLVYQWITSTKQLHFTWTWNWIKNNYRI